MSESDSLQHLLSFASSLSPSSLPSLDSILSADGLTVTLSGVSYSGEVKHNLPLRNDKTLLHSLASVVVLLLLGDPSNVSYMSYRKTCTDYGVKDPIKVVDRAAVWETLIRDTGPAAPGKNDALETKQAQEAKDDRVTQETQVQIVSQDSKKRKEKTDREETHKRQKSDQNDLHPKQQSSAKHSSTHRTEDANNKKQHHHHQQQQQQQQQHKKGPITQEDLLKNLKTVVDKRELQTEVTQIRRHDGDTGAPNHNRNEGLHAEYTGQMLVMDEQPLKQDEHYAIKTSLSSHGYGAEDIPKDVLEKDRVEVEKIMSLEMPVGTSATVLQCGQGISALLTTSEGMSTLGKGTVQQLHSKKKDFSMALDLYNELTKVDDKKRHSSSAGGDKNHPTTSSSHHRAKVSSSTTTTTTTTQMNKATRPKVRQGKPIIIVPNAMTSPITLVNATLFFEKSTYMPRDVLLKQNPEARKPTGIVPISRKISPRFGGGLIEYEIMDNPAMKLSRDDWDRVVAVIAQGASWQFKGWKMKTGAAPDITAVEVFSKCFGFYIGFEGSPIPPEVMGWNVKKGMLSKDKRGTDSIVAASFWNGLDEWMSVHKPEYLPLEEN